METLKKVKKRMGLNFLEKIDEYKLSHNCSYNDIAREVGISIYYFANLRSKIKKTFIFPSEKTVQKFKNKKII